MMDGPFALNTDGTARDPIAFQLALKNDAAKLQALQSEPDVLQIVLGDDIHAMQNMLRSAYQVPTAVTLRPFTLRHNCIAPIESLFAQAEQSRRKRQQKRVSERTIDAQRVDATVPR